MKASIVESDVIVNRIAADPATYTDPQGREVVDGQYQIGWVRQDDGTFKAPSPPPPAPVREIAPLAFMERFTQAERKTIRTAAASDDALADWLDLLRASNSIELDSPRTQGGMQALVDAGLLTAVRRDEILA